MTRPTSGQVLLNCLQAPGTHAPAWFAQWSPAEWEAVIQQALIQDCAPLLYRRLSVVDESAGLPASVLEKLRLIYMQGTRKNALLYRELAGLLRALTENDIPVIALKGIHLAELVYPSRTMRLMGDVDLLVQPGDLEKVDALLQGLGYLRPEPFAFDLAKDQHWPSLARPGGVPVELHWTIMPPAGAAVVDVDGLWRRAAPANIAGIDVLVLCPEDVLLYLCMHAAIHHRFTCGIQPLIDLAEVVRHFAGRLDWDAVQRRACDWRAARAVHLTLQLAQELLAAQVPPAVLAGLEPPGFDRQLLAAAEDKLFSQAAHLSTNFMQIWRPAGRAGKLHLFLNSLFPPRAVMARLYPVGRGAARLGYYYLVRLKDLLARYGRAAWRQWRRDESMARQIERDSVLRARDSALRDWLVSG